MVKKMYNIFRDGKCIGYTWAVSEEQALANVYGTKSAGYAAVLEYQRTPDDSKEPQVPYDC